MPRRIRFEHGGKSVFGPRRLVGLLSHDTTLYPGDVICRGTSLGICSMKEPCTIEGIGTLSNIFVQ